MEIYNSSGVQIFQQVFDNQTIPTGSTSQFSANWLPPTIGNYTVKIGLFKLGWAGLYEWTDQALPVTVLNRAPTGNPAFTQSVTLSSPNPAIGSPETITANITDTGADGSALIDIEVYQNGVKVGQQFFDNQAFTANQTKTFTFSFTPTVAGNYSVSVGVFQPGWVSLFNWFDAAATFTAAGAGGGTQPISIYTDALGTGWENWSWSSTQNFADTSFVFQGTNSIKNTYTAAFGGLFLHNAGVDTTGKTSLSFAINGGASGGQSIQVYTFDSAGVQSAVKNLSAYLPGGTIDANSWKQVSIPLADIGAQNKTVTGIVIQDASGGSGASVNIDSVQIQ
jgi:hypothetical protein